MSRFTPVSPNGVAELVANLALDVPVDHPVRVLVDGPECADPGDLAARVAQLIPVRGRTVIVVDAATFWRDASLRLEYGHTDTQSYREAWLDAGAITRAVLAPLGPGGDRTYLSSLRDPVTNRSTRAAPQLAAVDAVLLVHGQMLLGRGLDFDLTVHLALSAAALVRRTPTQERWKLAALAQYEEQVRPAQSADVVVSWNDAAHPAVRTR